MIQALYFTWVFFRMFRRHQKAAHGIATFTTHSFAGVPGLAMLLGTGREAWRVSDIASDYFAKRGLSER